MQVLLLSNCYTKFYLKVNEEYLQNIISDIAQYLELMQQCNNAMVRGESSINWDKILSYSTARQENNFVGNYWS